MAAPPIGKCVLIVDDDPDIRQSLAELLFREGFEVCTASNGQEALELLRRSSPPSLIFLDLAMPVMDGWQLAQALRGDPALSAIPVILLSEMENGREQAAALGAVGLLSKPITLEQLLETVRDFTTPTRNGILIVDDEPAVCELLQMALHDHGFTVWQANDGRTAIDVYRRHGATIGLVLLDVRMPGLDGPATLTALKELNPSLRSCFMSGHTGDYSMQDLLAMGAQDVFQKPLRLSEVVPALRRYLGNLGPRA